MKRMSKWLAVVLLATAFVLIGGCGRPEMAEDESDLPWAQPEDWEGQVPIGLGM
jgi:hypothetical protein